MEIIAFLGLMGHYQQFIKGFAWITWPLNEHLAREGASRKTEQVLLSEDALGAFQALKQACMSAPILAFADYTKDFLLKTDASKEGMAMVLSQKEEFLALKWVILEHFKEYLLYQPFLVRTDNNPLIYIMMTPNLDATGH